MCVYTVLNLGHVCGGGGCGFGHLVPVTAGQELTEGDGVLGQNMVKYKSVSWEEVTTQELSHILGSEGLGTGGSGRGDSRDMKSLVWAIKAEGWWSRRDLVGLMWHI